MVVGECGDGSGGVADKGSGGLQKKGERRRLVCP
jgi:hypothetical protein